MPEVGDTIRINYMKDEPQMTDKEGTIRLIDDYGQIHCQEFGLAVIPDIDDFEIIKKGTANV